MGALMGLIWFVAIGFGGFAAFLGFVLWKRNQYIQSGQEVGE